jgi:acyl-CoA synthetase (AMP-forming)/AMP-acid ligase II
LITTQRLVERSLAAFAPHLAVIDAERRVTYAVLAARSARLAAAFTRAGAGRDRPVVMWLPNGLEFIECDVACMRAGIPRIAVGDRLTAQECAYIVGHSGAVVLVTTSQLLDQVAELLPAALARSLVVGGANGAHANGAVTGYEDALGASAAMTSFDAVSASHPSYILYTSGTTGRPKGAAHSHASRAAGTLNMLASELRRLDRSARYLHTAPLSHGSGSKILPVIAAGGCSVVLPRFDPELMAATIRREDVTHTFLVPTIIQRLLGAGPNVLDAVRGMRQITFGGSPIAPGVFRDAVAAFGPILTQIYGSSEMPHPVTVLQPEDYAELDERTLLSAGRAAFGVDLKVVDESGAAVERGTPGELLIAGDQCMVGYWLDEAATREVTTDDGYYRSGDLARIDCDGLITLQDRRRDMVISGGLNIYPSEVERVLGEHPSVAQVAVVGAPDPDWGESVVAFVVVKHGVPVTTDDLLDWTRPRLASYKKPRRIVFMTELPIGPTGKVLKRDLREDLWRDHDRQVG